MQKCNIFLADKDSIHSEAAGVMILMALIVLVVVSS